ncbi:MAG: MBL fold metallo-hydrolase [Anaerolineae bacterium]|jgi:hydroxyacylglutathione hydrolase|nr:MBL fold metallo-hydrolase [Anaerolineae bacterium]
MLLKYFYDERLAQAAYLIGCAKTGEAMVIDPMRDITPYLAAAQKEGLRITHVTETHIHADFVSGIRELAAATGARMYLSAMGDQDWQYAFADDPNVTRVYDGDQWMVGNIRIEAIHTPGHTPEHLVYLFTDTVLADAPMGMFAGDFLFVGDMGRPDLLEEAAGVIGTKVNGAKAQFANLQKFKNLPDYLQILPGHGAGSACGKALGAIPSTTLGYEKRFNPAFQLTDEAAFVDWLLSGQPEPPRYFAQMKQVNRDGSPLIADLPLPQHGDAAQLTQLLQTGAQVFDLRHREQFVRSHRRGAISIPSSNPGFSTYVGWLVDYTRPIYLIVQDESDLSEILIALRAIGVDQISLFFTPDAIGPNAESLPTIRAEDLAHYSAPLMLLDVRGQTEYADQHLSGATHIPLGFLPKRIDQLPRDRTIITYCASGYRSQIAASWLRAQGFDSVINLADGQTAWAQSLIPVVLA